VLLIKYKSTKKRTETYDFLSPLSFNADITRLQGSNSKNTVIFANYKSCWKIRSIKGNTVVKRTPSMFYFREVMLIIMVLMIMMAMLMSRWCWCWWWWWWWWWWVVMEVVGCGDADASCWRGTGELWQRW
jgi:hypothetical protein